MTLAHRIVEQQNAWSHLNLFAVPIVLFGGGEWGRQHWIPILATLARWGIVQLMVVDRWPVAPPELSALSKEGGLQYFPWDTCFESEAAQLWKVAFIITGADAHAQVIYRLLEQTPSLRVIVCEKPCGESFKQIQGVFHACRQAGVILVVSDHYLLRAPVQYLLAHPHLVGAIGQMVYITAKMNESKCSGPCQGVVADMLVHLLDLLLILFPGARFMPTSACVAPALYQAHTTDETYCFCLGNLIVPGSSPITCELECGKQLAEDQKTLNFIGTQGRLDLNLVASSLDLTLNTNHSEEVHITWNPSWSYARLILQSLSLSLSSS